MYSFAKTGYKRRQRCKHFLRNANRIIIYQMVAISVQRSEKISEKSLCRPYPQICTGVNGENLQFRKYQFSASVF